VSKQDGLDESLQIPLNLHGHSIGNIKLRRKETAENWTGKEKELIEKIADQVALALENSASWMKPEKCIPRPNDHQYIFACTGTLDVEYMIRTAAAELRKVFDLKEAEVSIGTPQSEPARIRKHTSSLRLK